MGVIVPAGSAPALSAGRTTVEGYNPKLHVPFFDGVSSELADKGFITAAADDLITWARRVLRNPPTKAELARAKLVMAIDEGKAWPLPKQEQSTPTGRAQPPKTI